MKRPIANKKKKVDATPAQRPTKASFFKARREFESVSDSAAPPPLFAQRAPFHRPRILYEQGTGMAYAQVVNNVAVCLETGDELFRFRDRVDEDEGYAVVVAAPRFDFTPPSGKRHPNDRSVDVLGLVNAGLMSNEDIASGRSFSSEELADLMARLEAHRSADGV